MKISIPFNREKYAPFVGIFVMLLVIGIFNAQYIMAQFVYWSVTPMSELGTSSVSLQQSNKIATTDDQKNENQIVKVSSDPKIVIQKLGVDAPVVYGMNRVDEPSVQRALQDGILHFAGSPNPGQSGNAIFVGHSSNAPWAPGNYKFVFATLERMQVGDSFYAHFEGIRYEYKITKKTIVLPSDVSVLAATEKPSATLITCTPVGTDYKRLVILGEQVSPTPSQQTGESSSGSSAPVNQLPGQ